MPDYIETIIDNQQSISVVYSLGSNWSKLFVCFILSYSWFHLGLYSINYWKMDFSIASCGQTAIQCRALANIFLAVNDKCPVQNWPNHLRPGF